ncbi:MULTISPECIES: hypothetical protein [unclassified Mesorhizobium]|uniref:hypothetical protein n=1 Tax=unclassified Mesorhizobium TaxID=325217 RepID=UPI000FCC4915|nr:MULTISPECIES: hypothetical protein [unclassified Mesorhizobium]TIT78319.1 MAG: hypothetical protein E5W57_11595 [Mesorhizobium sp.]TGP20369.1 hypothetical protein EN874_026755 [Mesorhizobium sp. M1D.F.Ca.ET.231.01.1.1]TGP27846.1 hypothetical protein EN877_26040 [Mesorhizobium sp. M1D.F.Ca.ET.234.01.1.1]TGS42196.1 hypothetical protein EN827_25125 [Mesorhizobium sp. M1D.F.Ca.ET.184.01.1.1]TGS59546.1 hypothetical protein EN826_025125 [Mesorhizobium sp. M1D.F.Ca.ET.183.01.1.1]
MREPASRRFVRLTLRAAAALALVVATGHFTPDSLAKLLVPTAYAGNGHGGGNGGGNSGGGNSGGNSGNSNAGGGNANAGPGNNNGKGNTNPGGSAASHVNATTGDIVEIDGNKITVTHRNGMKEEIENGRFEMTDAQGRTIVERWATEKDQARLLGL